MHNFLAIFSQCSRGINRVFRGLYLVPCWVALSAEISLSGWWSCPVACWLPPKAAGLQDRQSDRH